MLLNQSPPGCSGPSLPVRQQEAPGEHHSGFPIRPRRCSSPWTIEILARMGKQAARCDCSPSEDKKMGGTVIIECVCVHHQPLLNGRSCLPVRSPCLPPSVMSCHVRARMPHVCMRVPCPDELHCGPPLEVIDRLHAGSVTYVQDHRIRWRALKSHTGKGCSTFPNDIGSCHYSSKVTMVSPCRGPP